MNDINDREMLTHVINILPKLLLYSYDDTQAILTTVMYLMQADYVNDYIRVSEPSTKKDSTSAKVNRMLA